jgi:hypothetical protein
VLIKKGTDQMTCGAKKMICGGEKTICGVKTNDLRRREQMICGEEKTICGEEKMICGEGKTICGEGKTIYGEGKIKYRAGKCKRRSEKVAYGLLLGCGHLDFIRGRVFLLNSPRKADNKGLFFIGGQFNFTRGLISYLKRKDKTIGLRFLNFIKF